jgi:energy-coupling factor transport system ATP-binding protein
LAEEVSMDIHINALSFNYPSGVQALEGIDLQIHAGERLAIIGQNGAGKTTLVKHVNGLLKATSGAVTVGGWDTRDFSVAQLSARVGYVFQNPDDQLFQRSVWGEVIFGPRNLNWPKDKAAASALNALKMVGLEGSKDVHPYDLVPSQRKLLALASVLAMDTPVLILDEPTTGQDYAGVQLIGDLVDMLHQQGKTIITITHDIDFCAEHFERVVIMANGKIILDGPAHRVLARTDILAKSYVEPPQLIRLVKRLGLGFTPLTVQEFVKQVTDSFGKPDES